MRRLGPVVVALAHQLADVVAGAEGTALAGQHDAAGIERGERNVGLDNIHALAVALDVKVVDLFSED